ncbi:hypothetical protein PIB30_024609 [Stylosanthes scabra]|uniref:Uncharacterized protein n=1 Tax=Stylosanthes scabra TaxID=79078 RepID=A0ABU6VC14_9FABA|nr:hypothetical protein [Stylosanthes scabra]
MAMQIIDHFEKEDSADVNLRGTALSADGATYSTLPSARQKDAVRTGAKKLTSSAVYVEGWDTTGPPVEPELTGELDPTVEMTSMASSESQSGFKFHTSDCGGNNVDADPGVFVSPRGTFVVGGVGSEGFMSLDD